MKKDDVIVTAPTEGLVTVTFDWETASALARVLGIVNGGSSDRCGLGVVFDQLRPHFGTNDKAKGKYKRAYTQGKQVYVVEAEAF